MADSRKKKARKSRAKPAAELTDEEVFRRLFPKPVRDEAKREAKAADEKGRKRREKGS